MHTSSISVSPAIAQLVKQESRKLMPVLTRVFGTHNLELVEDVMQAISLTANEQWKQGLPENPTIELVVMARNKVLDVIQQEKKTRTFAEDISQLLESEYALTTALEELLAENALPDNQLRMLFACCHPQISEEARVTLILKTLCGLSTADIAKAFLSDEATIAKHLYRTGQLFKEERILFELPGVDELPVRLDGVLTAIYLIFNEGYNSTHHPDLIRHDLIEDALQLVKLLSEHPATNHPNVLALMALMCFHAARIPGRLDDSGNTVLLRNQNRKLWNNELIWFGKGCLDAAAEGGELSRYHLEAGIAYEHSNAEEYGLTDWDNILYLYTLMYQVQPSPVVALNRAIIVGEVEGATAGLQAIREIEELESLQNFYLLPATLGEFHKQLRELEMARQYLEEAMSLTQSESERRLMQSKIKELAA